jgi:hypothetical protein
MNIELFTDSTEMRCENSSTRRSNNSEPYSEYNPDAESKYFIICKSCFWCASCLNRSNMITRCPVCDTNDDGLLDSIPISAN